MPDDLPNNQPLFHAPFTDPMAVIPPTVSSPLPPVETPTESKFKLLVGIIAGVELLVIIGLAIIVMANSKATPSTSKTSTSVSPSAGPQAATSNGVQIINDSISQDISSLNDDKDFPTDKFSDQALGL